jgi:NTP pyrophosphatase (non-canonical NTP hydrolase)
VSDVYGKIHKSFQRRLPKVSRGRWYKAPVGDAKRSAAPSGRKNEVLEMADQKSILIEVLEERKRQDTLWGIENLNPFLWLSILGEEVGECNKATQEAYDWKKKHFKRSPDHSEIKLQELRTELIQVAAVAVAFVESLDRDEWEG